MMSRPKITLATSHLDRHRERFTKEALESMVRQSNEKIIPLGIEHDPRIPPQGRILEANLVQLPDGEFAVEGIPEFFEDGKEHYSDVGNREIPLRRNELGTFKIISDRTLAPEHLPDVNELCSILNNAAHEKEIKKAFEPLSIFTIAGAFILGGVANGFLGAIGQDAYDSLKIKLKKLFNSPTPEGQEKLFTFNTTIYKGEHSVNVEVIITNPSVEEIQEFFDNGIRELDIILPRHFDSDRGFARIVFEYKSKMLNILYGVRKDGVPIRPKR